MQITEAQKSVLYGQGKYSFPVPGTSTAYWSRLDWIRYIDRCGVWDTQYLKISENT